MAKTLLLVRHAKSAWPDDGLEDYKRPLLQTGIERTKLVAAFLQGRSIKPGLILASHAVRALETAKLLAGELDYPQHEIQIESNIYYQDADQLYNLILALPDSKDVVMLVGHNPAMTQLANEFLDEKIDYLPTTGAVSFTFAASSWSDIPMAPRQVDFCVFPRMLRT